MPTRKNRETEIAVIRPAQPRSTLRAVVGAAERRLAGAMEIPVEQVAPDPGQPRQDWTHNEGDRRLDELAASIREFGILQPLLVRENGTLADGRQRYAIIAGARRHTAATRIGLATVPVIVHGSDAMPLRILQLIENVQRQDLSPLDEARAFQELIDAESLSPPMLAARLHLSPQHVRDRLRLIGDQVLADAVARGQITATTARDLLQLPENEVVRLRDQVRAGKAVQTQDVAAVREQLAASGFVNPRRKQRGPKKQTPFVSSVLSALSTESLPGAMVNEAQTAATASGSDSRSLEQAQNDAKKQTAFVSSIQSVPLDGALPVVVSNEAQTLITTPLSGITDTRDEGGEAKKQTPFVFSGVRDTASDAELLTLLAAQIAEIIGGNLSDESRAYLRTLLDATRENPSAAAQWWLLVDTHLRAQYGETSAT